MSPVRRLAADTFRSLAHRPFRLFFGGQLVSQVGNWLTLVAQGLFVLSLTGSGTALGLLVGAQFAPVLVLGAWAGLVADRSDKRRLLLVVQSVSMAQSLALAALAFHGSPPLWLLYLVAAVGGVTMAFDNPARRSFVVELVPEADVPNAVSLNSAMMTSSRVLGPALAGALIATAGFGWAFLVDGLSYVAVLVSLWRISTGDVRRPPVTPRGRGQVRAGIRYVRSLPELWIPLAMMAVVGTLSFNLQVVVPLLVTRDLGGSTAQFTAVFSVISVGSLLGALAAARRTEVALPLVGWSAVAFGASLALLALVPSAALAFPAGLAVGLASITFLTSSTALVQLRADPTMRGRVLALQAMVFLGSTPIGGPLVGWVAERAGSRWSIALGAVAGVAAGAWGVAMARRHRVRPGSSAPTVVAPAVPAALRPAA